MGLAVQGGLSAKSLKRKAYGFWRTTVALFGHRVFTRNEKSPETRGFISERETGFEPVEPVNRKPIVGRDLSPYRPENKRES